MFRLSRASFPGGGTRLGRGRAPPRPNRRLVCSAASAAESSPLSAPSNPKDEAVVLSADTAGEKAAAEQPSGPHAASAETKTAQSESRPATTSPSTDRKSADATPFDHTPPAPTEDFPYKLGDVVTGRVLSSNEKGSRIAIHGCKGILGYMPKNRGPHAIRSARDKNPYTRGGFDGGFVPRGLTRRFLVIAIPDNMSRGGRGPLLACNTLDMELMFKRLKAIDALSKSMRETIMVEVHGCIQKGLHCTLFGIRGFIPISHVLKDNDQQFLVQADLEKYVGQQVEVSLLDLNEQLFSFTCSMRQAKSDRKLRSLRIGSLVWGKIRRFTTYGAFLSIEDTNETALLHITNVSWHRVPAMENVFSEGDTVRAVVIGMDDGYSRLSVSTRDLEVTEGDMLKDPQMVYDNAERGVQRFLEHVAKWEQQQAQEAALASA